MTPEEKLQDLRRRQQESQAAAARAEARADAIRENIGKIEDHMKKLGADSPQQAEELAQSLRAQAEAKINEARSKMEEAQ